MILSAPVVALVSLGFLVSVVLQRALRSSVRNQPGSLQLVLPTRRDLLHPSLSLLQSECTPWCEQVQEEIPLQDNIWRGPVALDNQ